MANNFDWSENEWRTLRTGSAIFRSSDSSYLEPGTVLNNGALQEAINQMRDASGVSSYERIDNINTYYQHLLRQGMDDRVQRLYADWLLKEFTSKPDAPDEQCPLYILNERKEAKKK